MILAHKNSIRLLQLQPALGVIKHRHIGDKEGLNEAQHQLFIKEKYNPLLGILPLVVQLFLIMGMLQVMYRPLQHMIRLDQDTIALLEGVLASLGIEGGFAPQLAIIDAFSANRDVFYQALTREWFAQIDALNMYFAGLNLGIIPSLLNPSAELLIILLSGIAAFAFCMVQNFISPGALSQGAKTNRGLTLFTVGLSVYFAWLLPVGVGLYWTVGNAVAILVVLALNKLYPPKKLAAAALEYINAARKTPEELKEEARLKKEHAIWEKADIAAFKAAKKQLVFYALSSGQYRYYKNIIDHLSEHSTITIHYLTNDPADAVFDNPVKNLIPYYASQQKTIGIMLKLDTDMLVTTVPDLQTFHMKRSIVRDDIEYIFIPHSMASLYVTMKEAACDYFDTILCVGPHHVREMRRREELAGRKPKQLIKSGYGLYDQLVQLVSTLPETQEQKTKILIAPSWQVDNILDSCIDQLLDSLVGHGYEIIVRPHPQYIRMFPQRIAALQKKYAPQDIVFALDFYDNTSVFTSDIIITDWSNIAFEFSYCTLKPSIFIDTPMKVMNPNYETFGIEIVDLTLRNKVGVSIALEDVGTANKVVSQLLSNTDMYRQQIQQAKQDYLYYPGRNGEAGGKYIASKLKNGGTKDV